MSWLCKSRNTIITERMYALNTLFFDLYDAWCKETDIYCANAIAWHMKCTDRAYKRMKKLRD